jgi:hypothetical protein
MAPSRMSTWNRRHRRRERGSVSAGTAPDGHTFDYFPNPHAATTIDSLRTRYAGGDASSIINRIVLEWSSSPGRDPPPSV